MTIIKNQVNACIVVIKVNEVKWRKLGKLFDFKKIDNYLESHASNPLAINLNGDIFRVFSGRCKDNKSSVGYVDIDIKLKRTLYVCDKAIFKVPKDKNSFFSWNKYWKLLSLQ